MVKQSLLTIVLIATLATANTESVGQHYGDWGSGCSTCKLAKILPGFYGPTCGRSITSHQAANLWAGYCTESCSMNSGCGLGHHGINSCGVGNGCGMACGNWDSCGVECYQGSSGCGGCRPIRGLIAKLFGCGGGCSSYSCGCYQGCFGYPGGYSNFGCGGGCHSGHGCGCGLFRFVGRKVGHTAKGVARGTGGFASCFAKKLFGCNDYFQCGGSLRRAGCYGYNGGYFYDAPHTTSYNFGFYSAGSGHCDCGCDSGSATSLNHSHSSNHNSYSQYGGQQTQSGNHWAQQSSHVGNQGLNQSIIGAGNSWNPQASQPATPTPMIQNSLSPAGEMIPGQIIGGSN
ncbi:MAG: hypothetical protein AAGA30_03695 [Planctomycetota bacterium]